MDDLLISHASYLRRLPRVLKFAWLYNHQLRLYDFAWMWEFCEKVNKDKTGVTSDPLKEVAEDRAMP